MHLLMFRLANIRLLMLLNNIRDGVLVVSTSPLADFVTEPEEKASTCLFLPVFDISKHEMTSS